jgi:flavin reductase (DIM6/NTAB) family NADH-FMN oxidoreductase RutF
MNDAMDTRGLRDALGRFTTGVAVVTADTDGGAPIGLTINSFSSVSLDPPLVLFSIGKRAKRLEALRASTAYTINVLAGHQQDLSRRFARPLDDLWNGVEIHPGDCRAPILSGAVAHFECVPWACYDGGDHLIFVCRVERFALREDGAPLVFYAGRYGALDWSRTVDGPPSN